MKAMITVKMKQNLKSLIKHKIKKGAWNKHKIAEMKHKKIWDKVLLEY